MVDATLIAQDMSVARAGRTVVTGVGFVLRPGEALVVLGPNGAGKSTLLRALAGLLPPEGGAVRLLRGGAAVPVAEHGHMLGHADGLKGGLTAGENLAFAAAYLRGWGGSTPDEALALLGLAALGEVPVGLLSAGQRRRVALARLLVAPRPLWVLDEPATALDAEARTGFAAVMAAHRAWGGLVVAATHDPLDLPGAMALRLAP